MSSGLSIDRAHRPARRSGRPHCDCGKMAAAPMTDGGGYTPQGGVLITGGAGFIGSHVAVELVTRHRYAVVVLDILDYPASMKNLAEIADAPGFAFVQGSVCNLALVGEGCRGRGRGHTQTACLDQT